MGNPVSAFVFLGRPRFLGAGMGVLAEGDTEPSTTES